jgi:glycosyltransferase involved in cell wall biosynthesis
MHKITVIVCVYNETESLLQALRSLYKNNIYAQTEIIIIDDHSTNPITVRILNLLQRFTRYRFFFSKENLGLSNSRNIGFDQATTAYILPLDADDILPPSTLDKVFHAFEDNPDIDFIVGNYVLKNVETDETSLVDCKTISTNNIIDIKKLAMDWKLLGTSPCRKIVWERVGGYSLKYSYSVQDVDFWINVLQSGSKGLYLNNLIYIWNRSATGMNINFDRLDMIKLLEDHQEFYLLTWQKSYLYNKIFEGYYPYKQKDTLLPFGKKNFRYLHFKNKLRFLSGFFLW